MIINEAIELTKSYGGTDGHKFVNGVLDKLAPQLGRMNCGHTETATQVIFGHAFRIRPDRPLLPRPTRHAVLGVGDDGAIVRPRAGCELVLSTDMLVAGTHFLPNTDPEDLGWKTLAVNVSDMAAMGAQPRWALLAVALPAATESWIEKFARGFFACADTFGVDVIGGDTTRGAAQFLRDDLRRSTGRQRAAAFGRATRRRNLGLRHARSRRARVWPICKDSIALTEPALTDCLAALHRPQPRVALGLALRGHGHGRHRCFRRPARRSRPHPEAPASPRRCKLMPCPPAPTIERDCLPGGRRRLRTGVYRARAAPCRASSALAETLALPLTCLGSIDSRHAGRIDGARCRRPGIRQLPGAATTISAELAIMAKLPAPPLSFLLRHPAHLIACGFGSGLSPCRARHGRHPVRLADLSLPARLVSRRHRPSRCFCCCAFAMGVTACQITGRSLGVVDHGSIVWDEIVPFWAVLLLTPAGWLWQLAAFLWFRFYDIIKPAPARLLR